LGVGFGFMVQGLGFRDDGFGSGVLGLRRKVLNTGSRFTFYGLRLRVCTLYGLRLRDYV
jgi:hypothetical protein